MKKSLLISLLALSMQGCLNENSTLKTVDHISAKEERTVIPNLKKIPIRSCPEFRTETVRLIKSADDWKSLQTSRQVIGTRIAGDKAEPALDFSGSVGLFVSIGGRPTPGYELALNKDMILGSGVLTLTLTVLKPAADAILAQLVTYPCALLSIPGSGYTEIKLFLKEDGEKKMIRVTP